MYLVIEADAVFADERASVIGRGAIPTLAIREALAYWNEFLRMRYDEDSTLFEGGFEPLADWDALLDFCSERGRIIRMVEV
jgi:hypothetical protein